MHVSVFRVSYLSLPGQIVVIKSTPAQALESLLNLFLRYFKKNVSIRQVIQSDRREIAAFLRRCECAPLTTGKNEKDAISEVTQEHVALNHTVTAISSGPRFHQHHTAVTAHAMESTELTRASEANSPETAILSTDSDAKEPCKRKNEDVEDQEKSTRGKRRRGGGGKNQRPGERYIPPPQKRNPGVSFNQEHFDETTYYFEHGLRKVRPYYFDFKTYCKGRWIGKSLFEVFSSEFRAEPLEYYKEAAKIGRIRLNETPVDDLTITLRNNDHMRNTVHRHEPPVIGQPLEILEDNGEVLVVDKPASMPVHPCGRFRHNTVIFILGKERGICGLHTVHRLDRLTSGVLLFARTLEVSQKLDQLVRSRQLEKEYVCRVEGEFPEGELVCEEPILVVSFKVGLCRVHPKGKACRTVFQRLNYNGHSSVVRCLPVTGRTHQIRVHLQFLGFPILNDPIYGSSAWGPDRAKGGLVGISDEELLNALLEEHRSKESLHILDMPDDAVIQEGKAGVGAGVNGKEAQCVSSTSVTTSDVRAGCSEAGKGVCSASKEPDMSPQDCISMCKLSEVAHRADQGHSSADSCPTQDSSPSGDSTGKLQSPGPMSKDLHVEQTESKDLAASNVRDPLCGECKMVRPDPTAKELIMYLHALRYKGPEFEYSTRLPDWAKDDWVED